MNNIGSRGDGCYIYDFKDGIHVRSGCFFGTKDEFLKAVESEHSGTIHAKTYELAVQMAEIQFGNQ